MALGTKVAGLAIAVVVALCCSTGVAAAAAEFHSEIRETFVLGEQSTENTLTTSIGTIKCKGVQLTPSGAVVGTGSGSNWHTPKLRVVPSYSGCASFGSTVPVTVSGCEYELTWSSATAGTTVISGASCTIDYSITSIGCEILVHGQTPTSSSFTSANQLTLHERQVKETWSSITGVAYTIVGPPGTCGAPGPHSDGAIGGSVIFKGYSLATHTPASQVGVWIE